MAETPLTPEERGLLAAELALGVLGGADRAEARRLQVMDADFREAVVAWQKRFEPLLHGYSEVEAPDLWRAIEQRLPVSGDEGGDAGVVVGIRSRLKAWRASAILAGALAAGLAALLLIQPGEAPKPPQSDQIAQRATKPMIARLGNGEDAHQFLASYDATSGELRVRTLKMAQSDLAPELWVIPADNVPRSLGLVGSSGSVRVTVQPAIRALLKDGATLAVSLEERSSAPHQAPSSTPVAAGAIHDI